MHLAISPQSVISSAVRSALAYLHESQLPSGEFKCFNSSHPTMDDEGVQDSSPFNTALVAYCLSFSEDSKAKLMIDLAMKFLLAEMEPAGVFRYWTDKHPYYKNIPPDTDDTVCCLAVLRQNGLVVPDNVALVMANRDGMGRFYTWFSPRLPMPANKKFWQVVLGLNPIRLIAFFRMHAAADPKDVDGVVNANALFYTGMEPGYQEVAKYLIGIVQANKESNCDKWHRSRFNFYYSLSRNYAAGMTIFNQVRDTVVSRVEACAQPDGNIGNCDLDTALGACTLLNWGHHSEVLHRAINALIASQQEDGKWRRSFFYFGGPQYDGPETYYGWGSEELTTGFCLEALLRYSHEVKSVDVPPA